MKIRLSARAVAWAGLVGLFAGVLLASWAALQPPPPLPADAPATSFSEGRAREVVRHLAGDIGYRVNGTADYARAAEYLAAELRRIPGLEVESQDVSGTQIYRSSWLPAFVYRTTNVVARLPGRSPEAILLDAHFDTLADSVGAADDAAGVAAIVEALRVLALEAPFARTIVVNLNGGEEAGLFGAAGFLKHRWARDVRAYLYLEAFPAGRAALFGAGPGHAWLAQTYARVAPAPVGNVVGQDLVESGLLPHNGDFTPFHEAGLHGLDVAMTGDGWAYHDTLDRPARLQQGSLQHMGDTTVAVARALATETLPAERDAANREPVVFYDVLGMTMLAYHAKTGRALAIAALILAVFAVVLAARRAAVPLRAMLAAFGWTLLAIGAGVGAALGTGLLLAKVVGRPHGWFSAPLLVLPAFAAPALAATFGVHALWRRRALRTTDVDRHGWAVWIGGLIFWSAILVMATVRGIGAGYLALHWVWASALGLIVSLRLPRARFGLALAAAIPGAAVTVELGMLLVNYFVPITGIIPAAQPFDPFVAALVGVVVATVAVSALVVVHPAGGFGRAALACAALAVVGLAVTAARFPYTAQRPKRIRLAHVAEDVEGAVGQRRSALLLAAADALGFASVLPSIPEAVPARPDWGQYETWLPPPSHELPAPPPVLAAPRIDVTHDAYDATTDRRDLTLHLSAPGAQMRLALPAARVLAWSLGPHPEDVLEVRGRRVIHFEGQGEDGAELTITVRGRAPLPVELRAIAREPAHEEAAQAVLRRLPPWTTPTSLAIQVTRRDL